MAMVFSRDVLFLHVPKAAGSSVTRYLLETLPRPVSYVTPVRHGNHDSDGFDFSPVDYSDIDQTGLTHIYGKQHQTLSEARDFLRERNIDLAAFRVMIAVVRNPYDTFVSFYAYLRQPTLRYKLTAEWGCPPRPALASSDQDPAFDALVMALTPTTVARIEPTNNETAGEIRTRLYRAAARLGRPVEAWSHNETVYAAPYVPTQKTDPLVRFAQALDFAGFVHQVFVGRPRTFLTRLDTFYHLDGTVPPNLRIVRLERLGNDLRAALAEVGIASGPETPWLNRSDHADYPSYYDRATEAAVYRHNKWLFDLDLYQRLDLPGDGGG